MVADASRELLGSPIEYSEEALTAILSAKRFVEVRATLGGPAPEQTAAALSASQRTLEEDNSWYSRTTQALTAAERTLADHTQNL